MFSMQNNAKGVFFMQNDTIFIHSENLRAEIVLPHTLYRRPRFDNAGIVRQITLNGKAAFCSSEFENGDYRNGGMGLCGEFGIDGPLGFDEAAAGDFAVKIGVGLIKKPDAEKYFHERAYDFTQCEFNYASRSYDAEFLALQPEHDGYAYAYFKRISVEDNSLKIAYQLTNQGSRDIVTNEYCHNFVRFNNELVGPDYTLEVKDAEWPAQPGGRPGVIVIEKEPEEAFYMRDSEPRNIRGWRLTHARAGLEMSERLSEDACRFALWGTKRVISPELFKGIALKPGESCEWHRDYEFIER